MAMQRMVPGFRLHETPYMGDSGETYPRRGESSRLLSVFGFGHVAVHVQFVSSNYSFIWGGLSRNHVDMSFPIQLASLHHAKASSIQIWSHCDRRRRSSAKAAFSTYNRRDVFPNI